MAAGGERYTPSGLHTAHNMFYMIWEKVQRRGKLEKKKKVTEVKLKSFNVPTFLGDKYNIGTVRPVGQY